MTFPQPELDADGYPTEHTLDIIRNWSYKLPYAELMKFCEGIWMYDAFKGPVSSAEVKELGVLYSSWNAECDKGYLWYRLATCGWSGNESIISALRENHVFWCMSWFMHVAGGLYVFRIRPTDQFVSLDKHI